MQKVNQTYKIAPADRLASVSEYYFSKKLKEVAQMNGNTTFNRLEGRNPPCHTGFRQSRRTGIGTEPGISHLYFFEQDTRRGSYQLRPERGRWLDARFRNSGEYGFGPRKVDVDQLPEYADRRKRHSGTV